MVTQISIQKLTIFLLVVHDNDAVLMQKREVKQVSFIFFLSQKQLNQKFCIEKFIHSFEVVL